MDHNENKQQEEQGIRVVTLTSGGIDSSVMCLMLSKEGVEVYPLFIDYGQHAAALEWQAVQRICEHLGIDSPKRMDVSGFGRVIPSGLTDRRLDVRSKAFLPTRNLLFLTLGAAYAYSNDVYFVAIGLLSDAIFPDQTPEFISSVQKTVNQALAVDLKILTPLIELNKLDTVRLAIEYSLPIEMTYSCHSGRSEPCGQCIACQERMLALKLIAESRECSS